MYRYIREPYTRLRFLISLKINLKSYYYKKNDLHNNRT